MCTHWECNSSFISTQDCAAKNSKLHGWKWNGCACARHKTGYNKSLDFFRWRSRRHSSVRQYFLFLKLYANRKRQMILKLWPITAEDSTLLKCQGTPLLNYLWSESENLARWLLESRKCPCNIYSQLSLQLLLSLKQCTIKFRYKNLSLNNRCSAPFAH